MTPTLCISCGEPMSPGSERPPFANNPHQCVPCACGIDLPEVAQAVLSASCTTAQDLISPELLREASGAACGALGDRDTGHKETRAAGSNHLPDAAAGESTRDTLKLRRESAAPAKQIVTQAPFPYGRWTNRE